MVKLHSVVKVITILTIASTIVGCGFRQRGSYQIPDYLKVVCIEPNDPYEFLQRELRYQLAKSNIKVVDKPTPEAAILKISEPIVNKQILARGSSGQVQRFSLSMSTQYILSTQDQKYSTESRAIIRSREVSITNDKLLPNENAEQIIRKELLTETINELLRQFSRPLHKASELDSPKVDNNPC